MNKKKIDDKIIFIVLIILTLGYFVFALLKGNQLRQLIKTEPEFNNYNTDMMGYLKTYFLLEQGLPFYQAYALGELGDAAGDQYPGEIWGWKTPLLFYLWQVVPGQDGRSIYWLFVFLVLATPFISYKIASKLLGSKLAVLSSLLVWPYFLLPLQEITFIQVEWWALIFFLAGFYFLLTEKAGCTILFFSLALFSRELFAIHLFFLLVILIIFPKKRKMIYTILLPFLFIFLFYLLVHLPQVAKYENLNNLSSWWRMSANNNNIFSSWKYVRTTLAYNSKAYLYFFPFPFKASFLLSSLSLFYLYFKKRTIKYLLYLASFLPFFLFQFKPGLMTLYHDYWGIYYVPFTLVNMPVFIYVIFDYFKIK